MFSPPFRDPFNYVYDPLVVNTLDQVGAAMHTRFDAEGKPGVTTRSGSNYSTWWNGGLRTMAYFHNQVGLLTESIGNPTPEEIGFVPDRDARQGRLRRADRAADVALPAVHRLLDDGQLRGARLRAALSRDPALQHLRDGPERHHARQRGPLDRLPRARRRGEGGHCQGHEDRVQRSAHGRRRSRAGRAGQVLRAAAQARVARRARLRALGQRGRLPDLDQVRERADQGWRGRASRHRAVHCRRQAVPGRVVTS